MTKTRLSRIRLLAFFLLLYMLTPTVTASDSKDMKKKIEREGVWANFARFDNGCVFFWPFLGPDDFFAGLRRTKTAKGIEFRKGSTVVSHFPEQVVVEMYANVTSCDSSQIIVIPVAAKDFMNSLRFEANWERDSGSRPVEALSVRKSQLPSGSVDRGIWIYELTVQAKDVPLTDHLVVSIFSSGDKRIARLPVALFD